MRPSPWRGLFAVPTDPHQFEHCPLSTAPALHYRPEIDGLRALAVIPVVLFHAGLGFPGGFAGVDVFFVISGYLITAQIMRDLHAGTFSMLTFWERRARRILPASIVLVVAVLVAGAWVLTPADTTALGDSAQAQARFAANLYFRRSLDYFSGGGDDKPLLHMWSLAVEEQFYAVAPFLLLLLFTLRRRFGWGSIPWVIAAAILGSLGYCVWKLAGDPQAAFYLLPSRAWEMLVGAWVAAGPRAPFSSSSSIGRSLALTGIAGILAAYFFYDKSTRFPGMAALLPALGTALYIWASSSPPSETARSRLDVVRWLSRREVVFVGLISYSLYLWHWPLFAFSNYWQIFAHAPWLRWAMPLIAVLLAYLSWRFVEIPFRRRRWLPGRTGMLVASGAAIFAVYVAGYGIERSNGFAVLLTGEWDQITHERRDRLRWDKKTQPLQLADVQAGRYLRFAPPEETPRQLFVWGDSLAGTALPGIVAVAARHRVTVLAAWHGATPPAIGYVDSSAWSLGKHSPEYNRRIMDYIRDNRVQDVLLVGLWRYYLNESEKSGSAGVFADELVEVVKRLSDAGCRAWIMLDWPTYKMNVERLVFGHRYLGIEPKPFAPTPAQHHAETQTMRGLIPRLEQAGARVIDPAPFFLNQDASGYEYEADGHPLYFDEHHLSIRGADRLAPGLETIFE